MSTEEVTALQDLIAGGVAGSISVIVGHPFDTYKVRLQTSSASLQSVPLSGASLQSSQTYASSLRSLYRGIGPPLSTAAVVNALVFSSYGESSRWWDAYFYKGDGGETAQDHSSRTKSFVCGSFAGAIQALVICPSEHVKCRLQVQQIANGAVGYKTSWDAVDKILTKHGVRGLYRGFACTAWREIPAFGLYFSCYDLVKETINSQILPTPNQDPTKTNQSTLSPHEWASSALAGGCSGALTWAVIYPFDVIKTRIQTTPLETPLSQRRMSFIYRSILSQHGWTHLFRGLGVTLIRAFPVNGIIFPVYEFSLAQLRRRGVGTRIGSSSCCV